MFRTYAHVQSFNLRMWKTMNVHASVRAFKFIFHTHAHVDVFFRMCVRVRNSFDIKAQHSNFITNLRIVIGLEKNKK